VENLRSVVTGLLLSCVASTAFGQDAGGGSSATPRPFYVLGEISHPGEFSYRAGLNVVSAIAIAGGETDRASKSRVMIQHLGEDSFKEYPLSPAIPVLPGDTIKLPERYF
jgi:SLBB domain